MLIKFCVLLVGFIISNRGVLGLSEEMQELANMLHMTCVDETGAKEVLQIDEEGIIDEEATIAVLPEEYRAKAAPIIKKCGTKKGSTPCENAWLTHKCYQGEAPEDYILV
nr:general odorant-binding protein 69a-like isoform X2 [Leptinotarsa decemlineata]